MFVHRLSISFSETTAILSTIMVYIISSSRNEIKSDIRNEIKSYIVKSGWTITNIVHALNEKHNTNDTSQNLSNKLSRGTIKYSEAKQIAEIIGFKIEWTQKKIEE